MTRCNSLLGAVAFVVCAAGLALAQPKQNSADIEKFGVYPIAYRELITRYLESELIDPASAKIEWSGEPRRVVIKGRDNDAFAGWRVDFKINSRNKFGMYTGKQVRHLYLRNGEVIKLPR